MSDIEWDMRPGAESRIFVRAIVEEEDKFVVTRLENTDIFQVGQTVSLSLLHDAMDAGYEVVL